MAHEHEVRDADKRFSIDPITRKINNQQKDKVSFVQGDHNSERLTFEIPRYVDGHDMSKSTKAQVHYLNVDTPGRYDADDLALDGEETVTFTWLVKKPATGKVGQLAFMVKFRCYEGDEVVYEWNTATFTGINIVSGMDNGEEIAKVYADVLAAWEKRIVALEEGDIEIDLSDYALKSELPTVPTNVSAFENDKGYLTEEEAAQTYQPLETDEGVLEAVVAAGLVEPVATSAGEILTDNDGKIYSL